MFHKQYHIHTTLNTNPQGRRGRMRMGPVGYVWFNERRVSVVAVGGMVVIVGVVRPGDVVAVGDKMGVVSRVTVVIAINMGIGSRIVE